MRARELAFEPLPLRIDRVVPEDLPAIFARAAHLGRVVDESARLAEAIMIADAFERASASVRSIRRSRNVSHDSAERAMHRGPSGRSRTRSTPS